MQKITLLKNVITVCLLGLVLTSAGCKKNGVSSKKDMSGAELYHEGNTHNASDFFPAYNIVTISSGNYTDPHHYLYCTYTDKDGNLVTTSNGSARVTSFVDVL